MATARELELHDILLQNCPNVYLQVPSNMQMKYPCIKYSKGVGAKQFGNDRVYLDIQAWDITVIDRNPDSTIATKLESDLQYCTIQQRYVVDGLNHTTLKLYY